MKALNDAESLALLAANPGRDFVVYFTAEWCGVCATTGPIAEAYARDNAAPDVVPAGGVLTVARAAMGPPLIALDYDRSPNAARECGVSALPALAYITRSPRKLLRKREGGFDRRLLNEFAGVAGQPSTGAPPPAKSGGNLPFIAIAAALILLGW